MEIHATKKLFLSGVALTYFFAFGSLYFQVAGLYGRNGLLPASRHLKAICQDHNPKCDEWAGSGECHRNADWMSKNCKASCKICQKGSTLPLLELLQSKPTLLWLAPSMGVDAGLCMELLCIVGSAVALLASVSPMASSLHHSVTFFVLWFLYFSLYQVGETFLHFQWDILLLETGFIAMLIARWRFSTKCESSPSDGITFWLVRWLLFRLMFASGVVKLTSRCPTWWGLTALNYHYESQCIPTPLAWYAHQLPEWFQRLSVAATYAVEIAIPFLFFVPIRSLRLFAFYSQVFFQCLIIATGNYNFFNLLTMVLCLSLVDDEFLCQHLPSWLTRRLAQHERSHGSPDTESEGAFQRVKPAVVLVSNTLLALTAAVLMGRLVKINERSPQKLELAFSWGDFQSFLSHAVPWSIAVGLFSLLIEIFKGFYRCTRTGSRLSVARAIVGTLTAAVLSLSLFGISLVPYSEIDPDTHSNLWPVLHKWNTDTDRLQLANSYGLFRRMTGVGGRPEIVIEGSNNIDGPWKEYHFLYKPGKLSGPLPFIVPHQARLDWQMWFAALGSYQHNPWFLHLLYKLLHNERDLRGLMGKNPFSKKAPKFVRSTLYHYHYTTLPANCSGILDGLASAGNIKNWWKRTKQSEYTPPLTKDDPSLANALRQVGLLEDSVPKPQSNGRLAATLLSFRQLMTRCDPASFLVLCPLVLGFCANLLHS